MQEAHNDFLNISEYYYHTFNNGPGEKVLEDLSELINLSFLSPNKVMDFHAEIKPEQLMFIREGNNQVIRYIKNMIKYYQENNNG